MTILFLFCLKADIVLELQVKVRPICLLLLFKVVPCHFEDTLLNSIERYYQDFCDEEYQIVIALIAQSSKDESPLQELIIMYLLHGHVRLVDNLLMKS